MRFHSHFGLILGSFDGHGICFEVENSDPLYKDDSDPLYIELEPSSWLWPVLELLLFPEVPDPVPDPIPEPVPEPVPDPVPDPVSIFNPAGKQNHILETKITYQSNAYLVCILIYIFFSHVFVCYITHRIFFEQHS